MKFGFSFLKISRAVAFLVTAASASALVYAQKAEPTPVINQASAQLAAETGQTENARAESVNPKIRLEELIHLGDVIDVDVLGSLEYDWRGRLDSQGFLSEIPFTKEPVFGLCRT